MAEVGAGSHLGFRVEWGTNQKQEARLRGVEVVRGGIGEPIRAGGLANVIGSKPITGLGTILSTSTNINT